MAGTGYIQVPPDSTGKQVDMVSATVGGVTVARQVFALANAADGQTIAEVVAASASTGAVGVVVRPTTATVALVTGTTVTVDGTVNISAMPAIGVSIGAVAISGTAIVAGAVNISAMPAITGSVGINSIGTVTVTGGVAISGTAQVAIGTAINVNPVAISGTAQVAIGTAINVNPIALSAGTANIGSLNHISRSVVTVVAGFYPNSAGATNTIQVADSANSAIRVNIVAGGTGGGLVSVTGTVVVAGVVSLGAGTANIGTINNISATVLVAGSLAIGSFTDAGSYTAAQANVTILGGIFGDAYTSLATSQGGAVRITSARAIHVNLRDSTGAELSAGTATIVGQVSLGAGTANIGSINNISATVVGVIAGFYPNSAGATNTIQVADSANSALRVNVVAGGTGGGNVTIGAVSAGVTFPVTGAVSLAAGTSNIGTINDISRTVQVAVGTPFTINNISAAVQLAAGAANIGTINNISAAVAVTGTVSLGAGTANIGSLNDISRTVQVAVGTPFTLQGISTTVTVAGVISLGAGASVGALITGVSNGVAINISTMPAITGSIGINSISAGVSIAINAISAGVTIGINSISATVNTNLVAVSAGVAINTQARAPAVMSASRGPKCVTASTSANVTLIASPGAGANIYIKQIGFHNFSTTFTAMRVGTSASVQTIVVAAQSSGGGAVYTFDPPWMLSASEAALCSVKPNANYGVFNVQFYVI